MLCLKLTSFTEIGTETFLNEWISIFNNVQKYKKVLRSTENSTAGVVASLEISSLVWWKYSHWIVWWYITLPFDVFEANPKIYFMHKKRFIYFLWWCHALLSQTQLKLKRCLYQLNKDLVIEKIYLVLVGFFLCLFRYHWISISIIWIYQQMFKFYKRWHWHRFK